MKLTMGTSVKGGNLLIAKFNFVCYFVFVSLKSDINIKLNKTSNKFKMGLNWYPNGFISFLNVKKWTTDIVNWL